MSIEKITPIFPIKDSKKDQRQDDTNKEKPKTNFQEILDAKIGESEVLKENTGTEETKTDKTEELLNNIKPDFKRENFTGMLKDILGENKEK